MTVKSAADYDHNHHKDGQYWAVHLNLPTASRNPVTPHAGK